MLWRHGTNGPQKMFGRSPCFGIQYNKRLLPRCIHHFNSDLIKNIDDMHISGFLKEVEVYTEHLQRVRHINRGGLLLLTPGPVPLWDLQIF